jgi:flagellar hook-associated protein 3 FlgL
MRITPNMTANNALYNLQKGRTKLNLIQEQIASGMVINRPSDDPITSRKLLDMRSKVGDGDQFLSNIVKANIWLNATDTTLEAMSDVVSQVRKAAATVTSGSSDPTELQNVTAQLTELKKQLIDLGNTQLGDQYIFAGYRNDSAPFTQGSSVYNGSGDDINVEINRNSTLAMNITGDDLLKGAGAYGSVDILTTLDGLISAVTANNPAAIQSAAVQLDASTQQLNNARSEVGARITRMESAKTMITRNQNTLEGIISDTQNVDYIKAAMELNQQQTTFEAALSATAKISQMSLLDYLK